MKTNNPHSDKPKFSIPKDYFETLGEQVKAQIDLEELLGADAKSGFTSPEGYFEALPEVVMRKLSQASKLEGLVENNKVPKVIRLKRPALFTAITSAAAVALIAFATLWNTPEPSLEQLEVATIENYLLENDTDYSAYDLAELLPEGSLDNMTITDITDDAVLDYLDESIDIDDIYFN